MALQRARAQERNKQAATAAAARAKAQTKAPRGSAWPLIAALLVVAVILAGAGGAWYWLTGGGSGGGGSGGGASAKETAGFPYDIRGTWEGELTGKIPQRNLQDAILTCRMTVEIGEDYTVDRIVLRDEDSSGFAVVTWQRPDEVAVVYECREQNSSRTSPCLRAERAGRWFSYEMIDAYKGHIAFVADDFITEEQAAQLDQSGAFAYEKETDSLVARIDTHVSPGAKLALGGDAMVGGVRLRESVLKEYCSLIEPPKNLDLILMRVGQIMCKDIGMGGRHLPSARVSILDQSEQSYFEREDKEPNAFFNMAVVSGEAKVQVELENKSHPLEIRFRRDGEKTGALVGGEMYWTKVPLTFALEKKQP